MFGLLRRALYRWRVARCSGASIPASLAHLRTIAVCGRSRCGCTEDHADITDEFAARTAPVPDSVRYSGWAVTDRDALLENLARQGVTATHPVVRCEHVTLHYGPAAVLPAEVGHVWVVAVTEDDRVQALVALVAGTTARPDGLTFHITYSLAPDAQAAESGPMLAMTPWYDIVPILVPVSAFLRIDA